MDSFDESFKDLIKVLRQDELKLPLKQIEEEIFLDKEAVNLINAFQHAQEDFSFYYTHFKNDEELINKYRLLLVKAKTNMDNYPLIKKYNDIYNRIIEPSLYLETKLKSILNKGENHQC